MSAAPSVLLYDDGELDWVAEMLTGLGVPLERIRGGRADDLQRQIPLIITTAKRAPALAAVRDLRAGDCVSICVHGQDFLPLRERLRSLGFDFLVQGSIERSVLRLLLLYLLYRGPERRSTQRLPVGAPVSCRIGSADESATLVDLAPEGCRLVTRASAAPGTPVVVRLSSTLARGRSADLPGRVVRAEANRSDVPGATTLAVRFDGLPSEASEMLRAVLEGQAIGTQVTPLAGLEADPGAGEATQEEEILLEDVEQRARPRVSFRRRVIAFHQDAWRVVLGRDLSPAGMRVEPTLPLRVGAELDLELYGAPGTHPVRVHAVVARDDGEQGLALHFIGNDAEVERRIEALLGSAPAVEAGRPEAGSPVVVSVVSG